MESKYDLKDELIVSYSLRCFGFVRTFQSNVLLPFLGRMYLGLLSVELIRKGNVCVVFECFTEFKRN